MNTNQNTTYSTSPTYEGTLLVPARVDPATVGAYESDITTKDQAAKTNPFVAEHWDNFISQFPSFVKSGSIAMSPTLFNNKVREITSKLNGESDPEKVGQFVFDQLGWILPKDAKNFRYDPRFGYPVFERSNGKLYTKRQGTAPTVFTEVPNIVK
jgi:hypothetical protein